MNYTGEFFFIEVKTSIEQAILFEWVDDRQMFELSVSFWTNRLIQARDRYVVCRPKITLTESSAGGKTPEKYILGY